jgi:hypothetical protein
MINMERREFILKLSKSLLLIAGVTVAGLTLSKRNQAEAGGCAPEDICNGCSKSDKCGLPKKQNYEETAK